MLKIRKYLILRMKSTLILNNSWSKNFDETNFRNFTAHEINFTVYVYSHATCISTTHACTCISTTNGTCISTIYPLLMVHVYLLLMVHVYPLLMQITRRYAEFSAALVSVNQSEPQDQVSYAWFIIVN